MTFEEFERQIREKVKLPADKKIICADKFFPLGKTLIGFNQMVELIQNGHVIWCVVEGDLKIWHITGNIIL